ncbi:DUF6933 domain-containing protein [Spartinivicinus poritis]|uniref:DUF6933 domain-containing protein n=1 Tax=Spartinivicinus poritis TaxID=2994640 RepID=A0ABT5UGB6_9GAMM|nr:hypothetical protein [Spartinivicinus sp. A2-2]MDE1465398.1 hypothetical protein [Spartinivicinus sp. A2-2]
MLQLKLTQKVQKELGLKPKDLNDIEDTNTKLGDWFVNIFYIDRRKSLIFMNEKTLFSFMLYGVKKDNIKKIELIFRNGLEQALAYESIEKDKINKILSDYSQTKLTKTDSKKMLGNMNDITSLYKHIIYSDGGLENCNLTEIMMQINRTPQRNIDWSYSIDRVKELVDQLS